MRLLDVANVITGDTHFQIEGDTRGCAVNVTLDEACTDGVVTGAPVVTGTNELADSYAFRAFGIVARLNRRVNCHRDDDLSWLGDQLKDATDQAVGRSIVVQPYLGAEVWLGNLDVAQAATVQAARNAWTDAHVSRAYETPILHVAPENLIALVDGDVVRVSEEGKKAYTIWGDPVVVNSGYAGYPSFWTGDITVYLSSVQNTDELWRDIRGNQLVLQAHRVASVDIPPCSMVRVGAMPA